MFATVSDEISKVLDLSSASADFIFSDQGLFKFLTLNRSREELDPGDLLVASDFAYEFSSSS